MSDGVEWKEVAKLLSDKGLTFDDDDVITWGKDKENNIWVYIDGRITLTSYNQTVKENKK